MTNAYLQFKHRNNPFVIVLDNHYDKQQQQQYFQTICPKDVVQLYRPIYYMRDRRQVIMQTAEYLTHFLSNFFDFYLIYTFPVFIQVQ